MLDVHQLAPAVYLPGRSPPCRCGGLAAPRIHWHLFHDGTRHVRVSCGGCGRLIRFLPQTAANIATADAELVTYRRATRREELPPGSPVLLGFLEEMAGYEGGKPYLRIEAWCPACRRTHTHGWCEDWDLDTIHHKTAHCPLGTVYRDRGYHVGLRLDESAREYNRQVLAAMGG